jgi:octaprenyl-diphosphate synthase
MATPAEQSLIKLAIEEGDVTQLDAISRIVKSSGALEASLEFAKAQAMRAENALQALPDNAYKAALAELPMLSLKRKS